MLAAAFPLRLLPDSSLCGFKIMSVILIRLQEKTTFIKHGMVLTIFGSRPARLVKAKAGDFVLGQDTNP